MKIQQDTKITYPTGGLTGQSAILAALPYQDHHLIIVEETPFHPLDHVWPDQPADKGMIKINGADFNVTDTITAAALEDGSIVWGENIPSRKSGIPHFLLAGHVVAGAGMDAVGAACELNVDADLRKNLNAAHTGCHLVALALNQATADLWGKETALDSLGKPDLDKAAIAESKIFELRSMDRYRIGKNLRKAGVDSEGLFQQLPAIAQQINDILRGWISAGGEIQMVVDNPYLTARRYWHANMNGGKAVIPCGGTHLNNIAELAEVLVTVEKSESEPEFTLHSTAKLA